MGNGFSKFLLTGLGVIQASALVILLGLALAMGLMSALAALGVWPWLSLDLRFGETEIANAGMILQLGLTALAFGLFAFLPSHNRIMQLERSHRKFRMNMKDVAEAYWLSHSADRADTFKLAGEFDSIRERLTHMRNHPDLKELEPEILEIAAQMSHQSRDLAKVYSDEKVARARQFLEQRQTEVDALTDRIDMAQQTCESLKRWLADVEADERSAATQIERLEADLMELLPELGYELDDDPTIVKLAPKMPGDDKKKRRDQSQPKH
ncbi:DNA repair protein [Cognatishimia sp. SS12]|uniref:DNA repair protein n=1 Tax=Cognatishimia sp. SS12 TaxID=2979465 RepID=UPI00232CA34A|nr:DNA repair protein [Cognatishimia sp. SS12]MDC0737399.1 DNA repair protein [Cognatishimia sp. SS12]